MNQDLIKTLTFVAVALTLTGASFVIHRERPVKDQEFADQGQRFFPEFNDPLACTDLEVVTFDPSTAASTRFEVMQKNGKWVIPSHHDYPADARDRLSKTAGAVIDLAKDTIRSDQVELQQSMGVIDPLDTKTTTLEGRGQRVTLRDSSGKILADFIIGKEIPGTERGKDGKGKQRYVRVPGQRRTYGVNVNAELTTKFADWIETNLLKVDTGKIRKVVFDNYKMREARSEDGLPIVVPERGERITATRKEGFGPWALTIQKADPRTSQWATVPIPANQEVNEDRLRSFIDALGDLKIVGVRPKPPGLTDPNDPNLQLTRSIALSLQNRGFYLSPGHGLFSDQGDVIVTTDEGVVYTLRYGGPVFATGDELSAGTPDAADKKDDAAGSKKDAERKSKGAQENRYLLLTVSFDPDAIPKPADDKAVDEAKTGGSKELPDDVFAHETQTAEQKKAAEEKARRDREEYERKLADGKKKIKELADRFGPWYYVTPGDSFNQINLDVNAVLRPKAPPGAAPAGGGMPGGMPAGFPGGFPGGLPGGMRPGR